MRSKIKGAFQKASDFLKTKKFLSGKFLFMFFAVAIVVTIGASVPAHQTQAFWGEVINIPKSIVESLAGALTGDSWLMKILYAAIVGILSIILSFVSLLVYLGAWLVDVMLEPSLYVGDPSHVPPIPGVLNSQTVETGWRTVRDMCNTFFIFFLLLIAFSMILRIQKFGSTKTLLVKFIMAIFLINFSMVIAKIIIDVGQVFMYEIISWMPGGFSGKAGSLTSIVEGFKNEVSGNGWTCDLETVIKALFAIFYTIMLGLIYIMLAGFLLVRLVMFVILIILSPFAFLSIVLPSMSKYTSEWFDTLVKHSLFGPVFLFFIYLSATMANELVDRPFKYPSTDKISAISEIILIIIPNVVALCMLWMVIPVTQRLGAAGSKQLIGGTMGMGKIMTGTAAGIKIAGGLGKKVGGGIEKRSAKVRSATGWAGRQRDSALKAVGAKRTVMKNTANKEKAKEEHMKRVQMEFGDLQSIDLKLLEEKAGGRDGTTDDKALWLKAASVQGKLGDNEETAKKFMMGAEHSLSDKEMSEVTNKSLTLAMGTKKVTDRIDDNSDENKESFSKEAQARISGASDDNERKEIRREEIEKEKINDLVEKGETHKLQDLGNARTARVYDEIVSGDQKKSDMKRMNKKQRDELAEGNMANTLSTADYAIATADQKKDDLKFKTKAVEAGMELEKAFESGGAEAAKDIAKVFDKFDAKRVAQFSNEELRKHSYNASNSQSRAINRAGKEEQLEIIRESKVNKRNTFAPGMADYDKYDNDVNKIDSMIEGKTY